MGILYAGEKVVAIDDDDSVMTWGDVVGVVVTLLVNSPIAITVDDGIVDGALSPTTVVMVVVVPKLFETSTTFTTTSTCCFDIIIVTSKVN